MLEEIRKALRIKNTAFDTEITDLIDEAKADLKISGIVNFVDTDPLIKRAIKIYCKANFGLDNPDSEKYQESYNMLKAHLALAGDYNAPVV